MIIPLHANTFKQDTLQYWQWRRLCTTTTHVLRDKPLFSADKYHKIRVSTIHKNKICKQQLNLMWHQKLQEPWTQKNCNSLFLIHLTWFFTGAFIWVHIYERDLPRCNSILVLLSLMKDTWCKHWNITNRPEFRSLGTHGQRSKTSSNPHT